MDLLLHCRHCSNPIRILEMDLYGRMLACLNYSANVFLFSFMNIDKIYLNCYDKKILHVNDTLLYILNYN